jgi:serine acetyltransferase
MSLLELLRSDIKSNGGFGRTILLSASYRVASSLYLSDSVISRPIFFLFKIYYRLFVNLVCGFDVAYEAKIDAGMAVYHGQSIIVGGDVVIGKNVKLRQCTTIGNKGTPGSKSPVIGDGVNIGSNVVIIGGITIGSNSTIGSGSVVVRNVPENATVVGVAAREI